MVVQVASTSTARPMSGMPRLAMTSVMSDSPVAEPMTAPAIMRNSR